MNQNFMNICKWKQTIFFSEYLINVNEWLAIVIHEMI